MINYEQFQSPHLRVCILTPPLYAGGAERWILSLCRHFLTCKVVSVLIHGEAGHLYEELPNSIKCFQVSDATDIPGYRDAYNQAINVGVDIVVAWGLPPLQFVRPQQRVPIVHVSHTTYRQHQFHEDQIHANFLASVSRCSAEVFPYEVRQRCPVQVIHNGVEVERALPHFGRHHQRKVWNVQPNEKLVMFLGRFAPEKNPRCMIPLVQHLPQNYKVCIIGWGPLATRLMNDARETPEGHRILFPKPRNDHVGDFLAAADVMVLPSMSEAFSMGMVEAWIAKKPLIVTPFTSLPEIESTYGPHFTVVSADPEPSLLGEVVQTVASSSSPELLQSAHNVAMNHLTATSMAARWETYLHECHRQWMKVGCLGQCQMGAQPPLQKTTPPDQQDPLSQQVLEPPPQSQIAQEHEPHQPHLFQEHPEQQKGLENDVPLALQRAFNRAIERASEPT